MQFHTIFLYRHPRGFAFTINALPDITINRQCPMSPLILAFGPQGGIKSHDAIQEELSYQRVRLQINYKMVDDTPENEIAKDTGTSEEVKSHSQDLQETPNEDSKDNTILSRVVDSSSQRRTYLGRRRKVGKWWNCCSCKREVDPNYYRHHCPDCGHEQCWWHCVFEN